MSKEVLANNGSAMRIHSRSDVRGTLYSKDDTPVSKIVLVGVNHTPNSNFNLFSVAMCLKHGWKLTADFHTGCVLTKGNQAICFDIRVKSGTGYLWVAKIVPDEVPDISATTLSLNKGTGSPSTNNEVPKMKSKDSSAKVTTSTPVKTSTKVARNITVSTNKKRMCNGITREYAHVLMGHAHVTSAMATAKYLKFQICSDNNVCRQVLVCEGCAKEKARRKGVSLRGTSTHIRTKEANKFIYLDTSTIRDAGGIKVCNGVWIGIVDEFSGMATSMFVATKHDSIEATCKLLSDWKAKGNPVHTIRCDNAGENRAIQTRSTEHTWQLGLTFEFTGAGTPQQNALVEKFFETIYNRTRATMTFANIPESIKHIVCKMLVLHLTNLFNLEIVTKDGMDKTRFEWWGIPLPKFTNFLHPWGMAGIVFTKIRNWKREEGG